jgi:hypothetical protein
MPPAAPHGRGRGWGPAPRPRARAGPVLRLGSAPSQCILHDAVRSLHGFSSERTGVYLVRIQGYEMIVITQVVKSHGTLRSK